MRQLLTPSSIAASSTHNLTTTSNGSSSMLSFFTVECPAELLLIVILLMLAVVPPLLNLLSLSPVLPFLLKYWNMLAWIYSPVTVCHTTNGNLLMLKTSSSGDVSSLCTMGHTLPEDILHIPVKESFVQCLCCILQLLQQ
ncbi:hypothetical protein Pelo_1662 [Pelomyxa schiedti]|nr:hypothetical protein Pelo_1662 [Pelomyxa schiedti]